MEEGVSQSRLEARFGQYLVSNGADEDAFWACYNLVSAGDLLVLVYQEALRPAGLTRDEWRILAMLNMVEQSEPRRLAETLWLGRSTVVNAINRLEKQGLVTREQAKNDRRLVVVEMTEAGKASLAEGTRLYADAINSLEWRFTPEEISLLFKLSRRFWQDNYHRARKSLVSSPRVGDASTK